MRLNNVPSELSDIGAMLKTHVKVPWKEGLHLRRAAGIVRLTRGFRSTVSLRFGGKLADARSILSIAMLCASMGAVVEIEAKGSDAFDVVRALEAEFSVESSEVHAPARDLA